MIDHNSKDWDFIFWGMENDFSKHVLKSLLEKGLHPSAVFLPGIGENGINSATIFETPESLPISDPFFEENMAQIAWKNNLPLFEVQDLNHQILVQKLKELKPTVAIVACFPKRLPIKILKLPQLGFLNFHPSLLPLLRGPYPLFWTFRLAKKPGITLHLMDESLDTGDIVVQKAFDFPVGVSGSEADRLAASAGGDLFFKIVPQIEDRNLIKFPQEGAGSQYPTPRAKDFIIPTSWSAKRAFNFICGTNEWNHPYQIKGEHFQISIRTAEGFSLDNQMQQAFKMKGNQIWIQFNPGTLQAKMEWPINLL